MFEDLPKPKRRNPMNQQAMILWGAVVLVALPAAYMYWRHTNETAARETVQVITEALAKYHEKHDGYPDRLERLKGSESARPPETAPPERARLLPTWQAKDLVETGGYRYRYQPTKRVRRWAATVQLAVAYRITAEPSNFLIGRLFLASDESGEIVEAQSAEELKDLTARRQLQITTRPAEEEEGAEDGEEDGQ